MASGSGSSPSRSAASSGAMASSTSAARSRLRCRSSARWSVSDSSSNTSASRSLSSASTTSWRRLVGRAVRVPAMSAARIVSKTASRPSVPCRSVRLRPVTVRHDTTRSSGRRASRLRRARTASRSTTQSRVRVGSIAASTTRTSSPVSAIRTGASRSWPTTRISLRRWVKRRRLTDPVARVIAPGSTPVTRSIGTKIRRRVRDLDDEPEHPRRVGVDAQRRDDVADLADPLAVGTVDGDPHQACDEDTGGGHPGSLERRHHRPMIVRPQPEHPPAAAVR